MRNILVLLCFTATLYAPDWRLSNRRDVGAGARPWWCQSNCILNKEILFDAQTGPGSCWEVWSMHTDGSNKVDLSGTLFTGATTKNHGNASFSPDGNWILLTMQSSASAKACTAFLADPGEGMDSDVYVCSTSTFACTNLTTITIDGSKGSLAPHFTRDGTKIFVGHMTGVDGANVPPHGNLEICNWNPGGPSVSGCSTFTFSGQVLYEPHDSDPNETTTCTLYMTAAGNNSDLTTYTNWSWDSCGQPALGRQLVGLPAYSEFWMLTPRGNLAIFGSGTFVPGALCCGPNHAAELTLADAKTGQNAIPLTCFNTPGTDDYAGPTGPVNTPHARFNATGTSFIYTEVRNGAGTSRLIEYDFQNPAVQP